MTFDTHSKLSHTTLALHWIVAIMMITLLTTGVVMSEFELFAIYPWHKSFGVLIILFAVLRIVWRIKNGWPTHAGNYTNIEKTIATVMHWVLILGTVLMPISGFMMSAMGGYGVHFFGIELVANNPDPSDPSKVIPLNAGLAQIAHAMHSWGGYLLIAAVALHVVGALKHHIISKDGTLRRMFGASI